MKITNNLNYADGKLWRCSSNSPYHNDKYNIRKRFNFRAFKFNYTSYLFSYFYCFLDNLSIEKSYIEISNIKNIIDNHTVWKQSISNLY